MRFSYDDTTKQFQIFGILWPVEFFERVATHGVWDGPCRIVRGERGEVLFVRDSQEPPGPDISERSSSESVA